ncbi:hypothetical protein FQZ97_1107250 [compost metagenome]
MSILDFLVVGVILVCFQDGFAQDALGHGISSLGLGAIRQRGDVLLERGSERGGRREDALFEQLIDERSAECAAGLLRVFFAAGTVIVQLLVDLPFLIRVWDRQRLELALGIQGFAVSIDEIAFQATDHHLTQLLLVREDVPGEALVVQQFQQ